MNTAIGERIQNIINNRNIKKSEFANILNITPAYVSRIINNGAIPSNRLMEDICEKFCVSEKWLRTGEGEMFIIPEDDVAEQVSHLLEKSNPFYDLILSIMKSYDQLDANGQKMIHDLSQNIINDLKKKED